MPLDPDALVTLGDLAARPSDARRVPPADPGPGRPPLPPADPSEPAEPGVPPATALFRRRLAVLAAGSAIAGLVVGAALPAPAQAPSTAAAPAAYRSDLVVSPALVEPGSASPFAADARAASAAVGGATSPFAASGATTAAPQRILLGTRARSDALGPDRVGTAGVVPSVGAAAPAYVPTRPLPAGSGSGRRIVYAETAAHLWVVGADGTVLRDYPVTGRVGRPRPSVYHVYSKSPVAVNPGEKLRFEFMVRFAVGLTGARIGFHTIPRSPAGVPIQSERQLGRAIGAGGCVRQARADAVWLYHWARVGDTVVVLR